MKTLSYFLATLLLFGFVTVGQAKADDRHCTQQTQDDGTLVQKCE